MSPINECIDTKAFAALILDYEFLESPGFDLPPYVSGRVLFDGVWHANIAAENRTELIEKFRSGNY